MIFPLKFLKDLPYKINGPFQKKRSIFYFEIIKSKNKCGIFLFRIVPSSLRALVCLCFLGFNKLISNSKTNIGQSSAKLIVISITTPIHIKFMLVTIYVQKKQQYKNQQLKKTPQHRTFCSGKTELFYRNGDEYRSNEHFYIDLVFGRVLQLLKSGTDKTLYFIMISFVFLLYF